MASLLERHARVRAEWLSSAIGQLAADARVEAVVLGGSLARDGGDVWSDVDLIVCVGEDDRASTVEATQAWVAAFGTPLYVLEAKWNAPVGGAQLNTLYDLEPGLPLYVDWNLWPVSLGVTASNTTTLFERRPGLLPAVEATIEEWWDGLGRQRVPGAASDPEALRHFQFGMLPIVVKYCARGSLDERLLGLIGVVGSPSAGLESLAANAAGSPNWRRTTTCSLRRHRAAVRRRRAPTSRRVIGRLATPDAPAQVSCRASGRPRSHHEAGSARR